MQNHQILLLAALGTAFFWGLRYVDYARRMFANQIKPSMGYWLTMAIIDGVALVAAFVSKVPLFQLAQDLIWFVGAASIFVLAFARRGSIKFNRLEGVCLALSVLGLVAWKSLDDPRGAIVVQTVALFIAGVPYFVNSYRGNEHWHNIGFATIGSICSLFTVKSWSYGAWWELIPPCRGVVWNLLALALIWIGTSARTNSQRV